MELVLSEIKKSYKSKKILNGVSLSAVSGECIGILGANGSGKSTLLSILAGIIKPDSGSFTYGQTNLMKTKDISPLVAFVPQSNPLVEELNAYDNLRLWYSRQEIQDGLKDGVLNLLGIQDFLKTPVKKMSGGMQKRLSIACAVSKNPPIMLLDEPSGSLDLVCKEKIYSYYMEFKQRGGIILIVSHDLQELSLCDRCFILKEGILHPYNYDGDIHNLVQNL